MLKILIKKQITEIFRSYFYDAKKNRARSRAATAAYIVMFAVIMIGVLGGMFTFLSCLLCAPLAQAGMNWMYFALMGLIAIALGAFGSVFNTYSGLYLAKDNELLLSMPIPAGVVMASRLLSVYIMGLMYSGVVMFPAVVVYWITVSASVGAVLGSLLLMLLISVFVLTLSCALGWVVAKISLKLKNKSFITVIISLAFIAAYYFFYFKANALITDLLANAAEYGERVRGAAYPVYLFGRVAVGDGAAMLIVSAVVLALFAAMWLLISGSFIRMATDPGSGRRRAYRSGAMKKASVSAALLKKELGRFTGSANYMLNCGLGVLFMPVFGVLLLFRGRAMLSAISSVFAETAGGVPALFCAAMCMLAAMNDMVVPSVSLEGRSMWILQSLPVESWQVLRAKLRFQLILTGVPAVFCVVCAMTVYPFTAAELVLTVVILAAYILFEALFGLTLGLKTANLSWTSEITPVKQSAGVVFDLLCGLVCAILLGVLYLVLGYRIGFTAYMCIASAVLLAASALLLVWLRGRGCKMLAEL